jgi:hypothetical protein
MSNETHDLGKAFLQVIPLRRGTPVFHWADTRELEEPYRYSRSLIVRLRGTGIVLGWWQRTGMTEEEGLLAALDGYTYRATDDEGVLLDEFQDTH